MASSGPLSPGTMANVDESAGQSWTTPDNAKTSNNVRAICSFNVDHSDYLKATNFGFAIPSGATINGIVVEVERNCSPIASLGVVDNFVYAVKGGVDGAGTNKADVVTTWPTTDTYASYGSSSDLWGQTWADTDINASTFGFEIAGFSQGFDLGLIVGRVDHMRITVYYTTTSGVKLLAIMGAGT